MIPILGHSPGARMAIDQNESYTSASGEQLVEGVDYYIENGLYVFTERYLLNRGYCCESGCRHCPYGFTSGIPGKP
jgi:hypothetical protein